MSLRDRPSARLLVLDDRHRVLLFWFDFIAGSGERRQFWATPGGGLEGNETFEAAARRELLEETGLDVPIGPEVARNHVIYQLPDGETVRSEERFFLVKPSHTRISRAGQSGLERDVILAHRWWTAKAIEQSPDQVYPADLADVLTALENAVSA